MDNNKSIVTEPLATYQTLYNSNISSLINTIRGGLTYIHFTNIMKITPFTLMDWSSYLHISERTLQRYKIGKQTFDPLQSEKIIEISLIYAKGLEVFSDAELFDTWLNTINIALGKVKPKSLLDNSFGIKLIKEELQRIESGVFA